ncbi:hypothetical protein H0H87_003778 [Tephrocybe sp. NHM501043]|nr:hypothetical protein H0H87_003778 [Tephrocybe sp. NHM501043]
MTLTAEDFELYYDGEDGGFDDDDSNVEALDTKWRAEAGQTEKYGRPSIYVAAFEDMINTVYEGEQHLLTAEEIRFLSSFLSLDYNSRYCLIRLILRKTNCWYTVKSMEKFKNEVGEHGLDSAIESLCRSLNNEAQVEQKVQKEPTLEVSMPKVELIDLTLDSDDEEETVLGPFNAEVGLSSVRKDLDIKPSLDALLQSSDSQPYEPNFGFFLEDETSMDLKELLNRLNNEQLRELVKETKTKPDRMVKPMIINALVRYAYTQKPLNFKPGGSRGRPSTKSGKDSLKQILLSFKPKAMPPPEIQEHRLMQMALFKLGKTVRVNIDLYWLVVRLNIIYERLTEYPKSLLVPSLLTSFKKRTYPQYIYSRDTSIWPTREELMQYVEALRLEAAIETELEASSANRGSTKTPAPPEAGRSKTTPLRTPMSLGRATESPAVEEELLRDDGSVAPDTEKPLEAKAETARKVIDLYNEKLLSKWLELVKLKRALGAKQRAPGLERFEPGFIYTRLLSKVMRAMATLKLFQQEFDILTLLLEQTFWCQGKRAKWYDRRALLQTVYLCYDAGIDGNTKTKNVEVLREAMEGVRQALEDEATHLVHRPGLVRRLLRLEKLLKVPEADRSSCSAFLKKADIVQFSAQRVWSTNKGSELDAHGRPIKDKIKGVRAYFSPNSNATNATPLKAIDQTAKPPQWLITAQTTNLSANWKWKGKSIWRGRNGDTLNVEQRALEYYEDLGFKGFHSETRILTTLFALLLWDIIFVDVPGAFETAHQVAPLDLMEDSFYRARKDLIETRLEEIKQTSRAQEIAEWHDDLHREKNTWCVGVRWDICTKEHLLEIIECLGGEPLSLLCRLFCEDYGGRSSGVPDLIVWNSTRKVCKFVEVKGPGDSASDNQKLWFDSLLGAGADVEVCKVLDKSDPPKSVKVRNRATKRSSSKTKGKGKACVDIDVEVDYDLFGADHCDEPYESPSTSRKRRCLTDENAHVLPTFSSSATPSTFTSTLPAKRRPPSIDVPLPSPKRQRLTPSL